MKRTAFCILAIGVLLLKLTENFPDTELGGEVVINEVCSKNVSAYEAGNGKFYDWIELYNTKDEAVSIAGFKLTDKRNKSKYVFDNIIIEGHGYLLVCLTEEITDEGEDLFANFQLKRSGETIYLVRPDDEIQDEITIPELKADISYARKSDGGEEWVRQSASPGETNNNQEEYILLGEVNKDKPQFSVPAGFYDEAFELYISTENNLPIYYTLDGSIPDRNSVLLNDGVLIEDVSARPNNLSARTDTSTLFKVSEEWSSPKELVDKANIVRAVSYDEHGNPSEVVTATYFVGYESRPEYENISVLSIVTEPDNLFGYENGIYVLGKEYDENINETDSKHWIWQKANYRKAGRESEREAHVEVFEENKEMVLSKECGIRIRGSGSRSFFQKSLNIYARDEYDGTSEFEYKFWSGNTAVSEVTLFSGGNDEIVRIQDYIANILSENLDFCNMEFRPCVVFLDGEYWGLYYLTEKYGKEYISKHYGVAEDNVVMVKNKELEEGVWEDYERYKQDMEFIATADLSQQENYELVCNMIDIESYIDYYAFQIYIARCGDWPGSNIAVWKSRVTSNVPYEDGKWRWLLFDVNSGAMQGDNFDTYMHIMDEGDTVFANLMTNEEFSDQFWERFGMIREEIFDPGKMSLMIDELSESTRMQILKTYDRFYCDVYTEEVYEDAINDLKDFFVQRYKWTLETYPIR